MLGLVFGFAVRVLVRLGTAFKGGLQGRPKLVVRRDRSLGGKEVVVAVDSIRSSSSSSSVAASRSNSVARTLKLRTQNSLPKWWPASLPRQSFEVDKEDYQREANRIVRGSFFKLFQSHLFWVFQDKLLLKDNFFLSVVFQVESFKS